MVFKINTGESIEKVKAETFNVLGGKLIFYLKNGKEKVFRLEDITIEEAQDFEHEGWDKIFHAVLHSKSFLPFQTCAARHVDLSLIEDLEIEEEGVGGEVYMHFKAKGKKEYFSIDTEEGLKDEFFFRKIDGGDAEPGEQFTIAILERFTARGTTYMLWKEVYSPIAQAF